MFGMLPHYVQGRALRTAASLDEGLSLVVPLHPYSGVEHHNNDRLVHLSAKLRTEQVCYTSLCIFNCNAPSFSIVKMYWEFSRSL